MTLTNDFENVIGCMTKPDIRQFFERNGFADADKIDWEQLATFKVGKTVYGFCTRTMYFMERADGSTLKEIAKHAAEIAATAAKDAEWIDKITDGHNTTLGDGFYRSAFAELPDGSDVLSFEVDSKDGRVFVFSCSKSASCDVLKSDINEDKFRMISYTELTDSSDSDGCDDDDDDDEGDPGRGF